MQYYRAIIKAITATSDNDFNTDLNINYFFVSESEDLRYLRRLVRKVKLTDNSDLGHFAILLSYNPYNSEHYNFLDVFPIVVLKS